MFRGKPLYLLILLGLFISFPAFSAAEYVYEHETGRPKSSKVFSIFLPEPEPPITRYTEREIKGEYAERIATSLLKRVGYSECPAKYSYLLWANETDSEPEGEDPAQGIDGLFYTVRGGRITSLIINESKFQWGGGAPRLSKSKHGTVYQMSWQWINDVIDRVRVDSDKYCDNATEVRVCQHVCPLLLAFLRREDVRDKIYRTATVVEDGSISFYTLSSDDDELRRTTGLLSEIKKSILRE